MNKIKLLILTFVVGILLVSGCTQINKAEKDTIPTDFEKPKLFYEKTVTFSDKPLLNREVDVILTLKPIKDIDNLTISFNLRKGYTEFINSNQEWKIGYEDEVIKSMTTLMDVKENVPSQIKIRVKITDIGCVPLKFHIDVPGGFKELLRLYYKTTMDNAEFSENYFFNESECKILHEQRWANKSGISQKDN